MKKNNPRWGARRIVGELRKLGKIISKSTVLNILKVSCFPMDVKATTTRQIIAVAVTKNPTAAWLETVIRNAFMDVEEYPPFMVSDRDGIYGDCFSKFRSECYGITLYRTLPRTANCNAFIERWNRTVREELLEHRIILGERDLRRLLKEYVEYFNQNRPHQSLNQNYPCKTHGNIDFDRSKIQRKRLVDGLIVDYSIAA